MTASEQSTDAGARVRELLSTYQTCRSPYTQVLIVAVAVLFVLQVFTAILYTAPSVEHLTAYLFIHHTVPMWILAPLLHKGIGHFLANTAMLLLLLPAEAYLSKRDYLVLFLGAGVLSTYVAGWYLLEFGSKPHVASYGVSGFVYGLAGYALLYSIVSLSERMDADWLAFTFGISAMISVALELPVALSDPLALNPAHTFGFVFGVGTWVATEWV